MADNLEKQVRERYRLDSVSLVRLGAELAKQAEDMPRITVRLSRAVADAAVASWGWDQPDGYEPSQDESCEQRLKRGRAATLAMIGLSIKDHGRWDGDHVEVELHPWHLGVALEASDDA